MRGEKRKLSFVKMEGCGNDYIYFDCFKQQVTGPESLSVTLSDRHFGIGGDGVELTALPGGRRAHAHVQLGRQRGPDVRQRHPLRGQISL